MLSSIKDKRKEEIVMLHEPHPTMNYFSFKSFMFAKCMTMNKKCLWFEDGTRSFILNHIIGNMVLDLKKFLGLLDIPPSHAEIAFLY